MTIAINVTVVIASDSATIIGDAATRTDNGGDA
jgi:hypothetical protein